MIQKPAEGWGRESPAIATARDLAAGGKAAVITGGRVLRGLTLCALGGLWTFSGLTAGLFGNFPILLGVGGLGVATIFFGLRIMRGPGAAQDFVSAIAEPSFFAAGTEPLTTLAYSRGRLLAHAGFGILALLFALWAAGHFGGAAGVLMTLLIPASAVVALAAARRAIGDLTALRWDGRGLTIRTLFSQRDLAWSEVADIGIQKVNTYALFGLLRVRSQRSLMVRLRRGGLFGRRVGVSSALLDLEGRTLKGLVIELSAAQAGLAPPPGSASAVHPSPPQPAWTFDAVTQTAPALRSTAPTAASFADQPPRFGTGSAPAFGRRRV